MRAFQALADKGKVGMEDVKQDMTWIQTSIGESTVSNLRPSRPQTARTANASAVGAISRPDSVRRPVSARFSTGAPQAPTVSEGQCTACILP